MLSVINTRMFVIVLKTVKIVKILTTFHGKIIVINDQKKYHRVITIFLRTLTIYLKVLCLYNYLLNVPVI